MKYYSNPGTPPKPADSLRELRILLSANDVAFITGTSRRTVFRWKATGLMPPCIKVGQGAIRWRRIDIEQWIEWDCCDAKQFQARKEVM
ncbi:MAG: helix-turn-helix transcriptional regulator [Planctomycetota bacterium]